MSSYEFLMKLEEALRGNLPDEAVESNLRYYRNYLDEERRKGRSEQEILESLGDPRMIARTIIETETPGGTDFVYEDRRAPYPEQRPASASGRLTLILLLVLVVIVLVVGAIFHVALRILLSPLFWLVIAVIFLLQFFRGRR